LSFEKEDGQFLAKMLIAAFFSRKLKNKIKTHFELKLIIGFSKNNQTQTQTNIT